MARGIGILAPTAKVARERFLEEAPDRKVIACVPLDISDIPLQVPFDEPYWAIAFEDPDPSQFLQDADPIAKVTRDVREGLQTMVADPNAMLNGRIEGHVTCPGCGETVHLHLPPPDLVRRPGFGRFLYTRCPECQAELVRPKGASGEHWQVRPPRGTRAEATQFRPLGRGLGERRACVFCGAENQKISKEHLWSKWMRPYVEGGDDKSAIKSRVVATKTGRVTEKETWPEAPFGQEVSGPCKRCNEGWMEQLEDDARPFLIPMLESRQAELRPEAQRAIAHWATLKLLVAHLGHTAGKQSIPVARYRQFFIDRSLSPGAQVWIACCSGAGVRPTNYNYLEMFVSENGGIEPEVSNAYLGGFSVGHLAFFYWGHEIHRGPIPDVSRVDGYLASVWPATGTASWPPEQRLDGDGIRFVMDRFPVDRWMEGPGSRAFHSQATELSAFQSGSR